MAVDHPVEPVRDLVIIAHTMKYGVRVVPSEDMSRSWRLDSVRLTHQEDAKTYGRLHALAYSPGGNPTQD